MHGNGNKLVEEPKIWQKFVFSVVSHAWAARHFSFHPSHPISALYGSNGFFWPSAFYLHLIIDMTFKSFALTLHVPYLSWRKQKQTNARHLISHTWINLLFHYFHSAVRIKQTFILFGIKLFWHVLQSPGQNRQFFSTAISVVLFL